ncbi:hypothetical protein ACFX11_030044 [Malus domestica]
MREEVLVISNTNKKPYSKNHVAVVLKPNGKNLKTVTKSHSNNKNSMKVRNTDCTNNKKIPPSKDDTVVPFLCYNCDKPGHLARNCLNKRRNAPQANLTEDQLVAMVSEINLVDGSEG